MIPGHPTRHTHKRFYLFLTTVVVGAILLLTLLNDEGEFGFLTGSSIGLEDKAAEEKALEEISRGEEIEVKLNFDIVPEAGEETSSKLIKLTFDDLTSKIKINEEELELKNLEQVEMEIEDFGGELDFDEMSISLMGKGNSVTINGIEISTKGKMEVSFKDLIYETLGIEGTKLNLMEFGEGSGKLVIGDKLDYSINNEEVTLTSFEGDLSVGLGNESLVVLEGIVGGISVEGEFDLTLG